MEVSRYKTLGLVLVMLVVGSYNTMNTKFQFQSCVPVAHATSGEGGCPEGHVKFNKPWLSNLFMFMGESTLLIVYNATRRARAARQLQAAQASRASDGATTELIASQRTAKLPLYIFAVPAFCDVFGTGLAMVGMQYMDSAIWQMLRSSIIIFSAICSVIFLGRKLEPFHWLATGIVFIGLILVGLASLLDAGETGAVSSSERLFGMVLVVGAQLCAAFQMVFEEKLLVGRVKTSAKKVVGMEGAWGIFFMAIGLSIMSSFPGPDAGGPYESTPEGLYMVMHSPGLMFLVVTYMCSIAVYNLTGIIVGKKMSAVVRCLVDSCRTFVVWGVNLLIYYCISEQYGSSWQTHSWLTLVGFAVLISGTLLYNEVLPVPDSLRRSNVVTQEPSTPGDSYIRRSVCGMDDVLAKVDQTDEAEVDLDETDVRTAEMGSVPHRDL